VRLDPKLQGIDLDSLMYGKIPELTEEDMKIKKQITFIVIAMMVEEQLKFG